jgi:CRP-like cAMP-binding protein
VSRSAVVELQRFVDRLLLRSVLSSEEQDAILALPTSPAALWAKEDFVRVNEVSSYSCLITSGIVGRFNQLDSGVRQTLAFHIPGEMADLHSAVRPIGVGGLQALTETTILRIPHRAIRETAARYPAVAEALWRDCMYDAAVLMQWTMNVGRRNSKTRLAHLFCEMAIRFGKDGQPAAAFEFGVTQEQLADAVALTSIHVNRSLRALRESGMVTVERRRLTIKDWDRLAHYGEFDPAYLLADTGPYRQKRLLEV